MYLLLQPHLPVLCTCLYLDLEIISNKRSSAFGLTAYTAGLSEVVTRFDVSMTKAILGMSLYLFGIAFAPIYTPHLSERFGRVPVYLTSFPIFMLFILGAGFSRSFASLTVCRFFAGFFGGPSLVLIEGTYADVWHFKITGTHYSVLSLAPYIGAAAGTTAHLFYRVKMH